MKMRWDGRLPKDGAAVIDEPARTLVSPQEKARAEALLSVSSPDFALELLFGPFQGEPDPLTRRVRLTAEVRGIERSAHDDERERYLRAYVDAAGSEREAAGVRGAEVVVYPAWCSLDGVVRVADLPGKRWRVTTTGVERL